MIADILNNLANGVIDLLIGLVNILPVSPDFTSELANLASVQIVISVMQWVNWFLPLDVAAAMIATWATAMMFYLGVKLAWKGSGGRG